MHARAAGRSPPASTQRPSLLPAFCTAYDGGAGQRFLLPNASCAQKKRPDRRVLLQIGRGVKKVSARAERCTHRQVGVLRALSECGVLLTQVLIHLRQQHQSVKAVPPLLLPDVVEVNSSQSLSRSGTAEMAAQINNEQVLQRLVSQVAA